MMQSKTTQPSLRRFYIMHNKILIVFYFLFIYNNSNGGRMKQCSILQEVLFT